MGILLEIRRQLYHLKKPLIIYNFFNKFSENKIINFLIKYFIITVEENSKLNLIGIYSINLE